MKFTPEKYKIKDESMVSFIDPEEIEDILATSKKGNPTEWSCNILMIPERIPGSSSTISTFNFAISKLLNMFIFSI